ncbi:unnamed protein product [Dovyalis caffra]|uniref:Uncharacterized protein n=1 Tax=Dovyalis caffra TaxID=77055 RepID=A0AAV1SLR0_9ROSI|nr:unnamed protein product [Dovyalis caffra]
MDGYTRSVFELHQQQVADHGEGEGSGSGQGGAADDQPNRQALYMMTGWNTMAEDGASLDDLARYDHDRIPATVGQRKRR